MNSKRKFFYMLCLAAVISCNRTQVTNPVIEGELYAKNTVKAVFRGTPDAEYAYAWHVSDRPDGDWTLLQGIRTSEIVLLTEYAGKYLKCEITATKQGKIFPAVAGKINQTAGVYELKNNMYICEKNFNDIQQ